MVDGIENGSKQFHRFHITGKAKDKTRKLMHYTGPSLNLPEVCMKSPASPKKADTKSKELLIFQVVKIWLQYTKFCHRVSFYLYVDYVNIRLNCLGLITN